MSFRKRKCEENTLSPWGRITKSQCFTEDDEEYISNYAQILPKFCLMSDENTCLDLSTKRAAIKVSRSVVSLVTYSADGKEIFHGSGIIIEADGIILTSAYVVRSPTGENIVADNVKVIVYLFDGRSLEAILVVHDFHYNFAIVKIQSDIPLHSACMVSVSDFLSLDSREQGHSSTFTLTPGDDVIALGRHFTRPYDLMVAPGEFSVYDYHTEYDCKELFMSTCIITTTGIGGPLINGAGEVIGIIFQDRWCTPFVPINVALKWWSHYKRNKVLRRPWIGMGLTNLYAVRVPTMEKLIHKLPNNFSGVMVEEVIRGSPADSIGMRPNDLIVGCCGKGVRSFLELFDMVWEKAGGSVDLVVVRASEDGPLQLTLTVIEATQDKLYSWPLCEDIVEPHYC